MQRALPPTRFSVPSVLLGMSIFGCTPAENGITPPGASGASATGGSGATAGVGASSGGSAGGGSGGTLPAAGGVGGVTGGVGGGAGGLPQGGAGAGGSAGVGASAGSGGAAGNASVGGSSGIGGSGLGGAGSGGAAGAGPAGTAGTGGVAGSGMAGSGGVAGSGMAGSSGIAGSGGLSAACMNPTTLKQAAMCAGRPIGVALAERYMGDMDYVERAHEFNYVTPEDEMKWDATEPTRGNFTFDQADVIVDFAEANGMAVKGHTLLWHNQLPSWLTAITNATQLRTAMVDHINGLMTYYRGKVIAWDVVNEAWDDNGQLRDSVWSRVIGESFIEEAFRAARAADPTVKLYYNDYDIESDYAKTEAVYAMAQDFVRRGVPIDGIGMQMHTRTADIDPPIPEFVANIDRFIALGLDVVLSEMDVRLCADGTFEKQAQRYHDIIAVCVARPKCTAITFWGITDQYSFLNARTDLECAGAAPPRPLLWTDDYVKKPAFQAVIDALVGR